MQIDTLCVNTIRFLAADAVEKAKSGHPGAPMGMAPSAYVLWSKFLKHNPKNPNWVNRDRFVLSAGHASMLLYSLLHLSGYEVSLDDIKNFRQLDSITAGHPEYGVTPGVEITTGPLGQGFSSAIGMAFAEKKLSNHFNRDNYSVMDHFTYVFASDGDLMEGISYEAASLAGHWKLGKLICLYDDNEITIDGESKLSFSEDVKKRFEAINWHVQVVENGDEDLDGIEKAIASAQAESNKPSIIITRTTIGYGSPNKQNKASSHGAPLGEEEVGLSKKNLGWPEEKFHIPKEVYEEFGKESGKGESYESDWSNLWDSYKKDNPELAKEWEVFFNKEIKCDWNSVLPEFKGEDGSVASRSASGKTLNAVSKYIPNLITGSADLSDSVNTTLKDEEPFSSENLSGRNIHYGVREHAMAAIMNGTRLHGGLVPVVGTFLIFSDYMKPSIRLAALMGVPSIFVFSHDSIGLGEDGPTHQPIEQLVGLRGIPNLNVIRPGDANEARSALRSALERVDGPTAVVLTRQKIPVYSSASETDELVSKGAYILKKESNGEKLDLILLASGSEVHVALDAAKALEEKGASVRVVSFPSWELFRNQSDSYKEEVLPKACANRIVIEAASSIGWHEFVGSSGDFITIDRFGASAPGPVLLEKFGFSSKAVVDRATKLLNL